MMDFKNASKLSLLIAKDYAEDFLRLLVMYKDISASEAASRLNLHIKTSQDFLEGLNCHGIVSRKESMEGKRPYFRYRLKQKKLVLEIDFASLFDKQNLSTRLKHKVKERKNSGAVFKSSTKHDFITEVHFFIGSGRTREERKLSLTRNQGNFLYYLPFPTEAVLSIAEIISKANISESNIPEILDMVEFLEKFQIIEISKA